jgi:putative ABC transport system permease protein
LSELDLGYDPDRLLTSELALPPYKYPEPSERVRFASEVIHEVGAIPGVASVCLASRLPVSSGSQTRSITVDGGLASEPGSQLLTNIYSISADYFETMTIPLLRGRLFTREETEESRAVVIVSEGFADRFLTGENPVGRRIRFGMLDDRTAWLTVVGVVGDVEESYEVEETLYLPYVSDARTEMTILVKSDLEPEFLADELGVAIRDIDPDQPLAQISTMHELVSDSRAPVQLSSSLMQVFAAIAVLLALLGLYGVVSFSVASRMHEIGIRKALGCQTSGVVGLVLKFGVLVGTGGIVLGLPCAIMAISYLSGFLNALNPNTPTRWRLMSEVAGLPAPVYCGITLALLVVALLACISPAIRANRIDPTEALRSE